MKTDDEIYQIMDQAESEIRKIESKYKLMLGPARGAGNFSVLIYVEELDGGRCRVLEREMHCTPNR